MRRFLFIYFFLLMGCQQNFIIKTIKIGEENYEVKIPKNETFEEGIYDEDQAVRVIYLNLPQGIKNKISLNQLGDIISIQGDYIVKHQDSVERLVLMDEKNIKFLLNEINKKELNINKEEVVDIFEIDNYYSELIGINE